jgi:cysteine-S-conjugate beta-lyase
MSQNLGFNRRAFFKNAQLAALVGAVGSRLSKAAPDAVGGTSVKYDFDTPYSRIGTDSTKWDAAMKTNNVDHLVAGMGIADMDFKCAPCITQALAHRIQHENWGYITVPASYADGIVKWNKKRYGIDIDRNLMGLTTGVHPGLVAALKAFSPPGSKVLLTTPVYSGFYGDLRYCNLQPNESLMKFVNGRYQIDFEDFERRIDRQTNTFILCNPQNPTGNHWSREDLNRMGEICLRRRVIVLADEIHCDFLNKGETYTPFSTLENRDVVNNSLTFKSGSKSFCLAGMKAAWFFSTNEDYFRAVSAQNRADLSTLGMIAEQAAYAEGEDWLNQCVEYIDGNHDFVQAYFKSGKMPSLIKMPAKAQGTYLTWIDVTGLAEKIGAKQQAAEATRQRGQGGGGGRGVRGGAGGPAPVAPEAIVESWLAKNAFVALNAGNSFGLGGENHMRMNIAASRKTLQAALDSMAAAVTKLG